ncbi:MAG: nucleotidyltransferase family protein [Paludibacteraceae bacterium]|nr:nucleotidyltransferase family protein [Paludibacteraceae bacterium]
MEIVETYLELLKAAIGGNNGERLAVSGERLTEVIRLAAFQGTGPLVFDQLLKQKDVEIPAALRMQMKQQCMMSMMQQSTMMPILGQAWKAFEKAEIHPVLLKGFALAQHYPQPHLRQWGDIDLYVGQKQYHDACAVLREAFPEAKHPKEEFEFLKHYNFVFGDTVLEMHRISMDFHHPRDRRYYEGLEEKYLTKDGPSFEVNGLQITTPEETFNVFFTFLHAWHHFMETGMNMKQVCDIAVLLHAKREVLDRKQLKEMLTKLYLMEVWQLVMYIIVQHLGLSQEEAPFYTERCKERAELLFKRILKEGSSRQTEKINAEGASYLKRKWMTLQSRLADSRIVKPFAPKYARHMAISDILHGIERTIKGSEKAYNVECV